MATPMILCCNSLSIVGCPGEIEAFHQRYVAGEGFSFNRVLPGPEALEQRRTQQARLADAVYGRALSVVIATRSTVLWDDCLDIMELQQIAASQNRQLLTQTDLAATVEAHDPARAEQLRKLARARDRAREKFGAADIEDWRERFWGAPYDINAATSQPVATGDGMTGLHLRFVTVDMPPIALVERLALDHPELTFMLDYMLGQGAAYGNACYVQGKRQDSSMQATARGSL